MRRNPGCLEANDRVAPPYLRVFAPDCEVARWRLTPRAPKAHAPGFSYTVFVYYVLHGHPLSFLGHASRVAHSE